eukprot:139887_1
MAQSIETTDSQNLTAWMANQSVLMVGGKAKRINLNAVNSRGELETLYRWIGRDPKEIHYDYHPVGPPNNCIWTCQCSVSYKQIPLQTQFTCRRKKDAMQSASKAMMKEIIAQINGNETKDHIQYKPPIHSIKYSAYKAPIRSNNAAYVWKFSNRDCSTFYNYDNEQSVYLESKYHADKNSIFNMRARGNTYSINLNAMTQSNLSTGTTRTIRRILLDKDNVLPKPMSIMHHSNTQHKRQDTHTFVPNHQTNERSALQKEEDEMLRIAMARSMENAEDEKASKFENDKETTRNENQNNEHTHHITSREPRYEDAEHNMLDGLDEQARLKIAIERSMETARVSSNHRNQSKSVMPGNAEGITYDEKKDEKPRNKSDKYTHHIATIIAQDFEEQISRQPRYEDVTKHYVTESNEKYNGGYLYRIKSQSHGPNDSEQDKKCNESHQQYEFGVILSSMIPAKYMQSIRFPVLIQKQIDKQLREPIKFYIDSKSLDTSFDIQFENQQISLGELLPHTDTFTEHRLKLQWFEKLKNYHRFTFKQLNPNWIQEESHQMRYYYICPLLQGQIDFKCIHKLSVSSEMNGTQYIKTFREDALKYEMVMYQNQLCLSYGFCKKEYMQKRSHILKQSELLSDIGSVHTYASSTVVNFADRDELSSRKQMQGDYVVLIRHTKVNKSTDNVENILAKDPQSINGRQLQSKMRFVSLNQISPTGIKANQYYAAKNLPAILWGIENHLNMIDLNEQLRKLDDCIDMDISVLFDVLNRCKSGDQSYQKIYKLKYVLRALLTISAFSSNAFADAQAIKTFVEKRSSVHSPILQAVAGKLNLLSYVIVQDFHVKATRAWPWHPPGFKPPYQSIYGKYKPPEIGPSLLLSVIGAYFVSETKRIGIPCNRLGNAMSSTLHFLHKLDVISTQDTIVDASFCGLNDGVELKDDETVNALIALVVVNGHDEAFRSSSKTIYASMGAVCYGYSQCGISLHRLSILGDALLDLFVIWFIYVNTTNNEKSMKQVTDKIKDKDQLKFWQNAMEEERFRWINDRSLAAHTLIFQEYIRWYSDEQRAQIKEAVKNALETYTMTSEACPSNRTELGLLEEQATPTGLTGMPKAPLKCLSDTFDALLASIFLCGNEDLYVSKNGNITNCYWSCALCIEFLTTFLGNQDNWKRFNWREWTC